jgi:aminoglycoside phosphotransferase (APT) family kinase protein
VQTWLEGVDAFRDDPGASAAFARDLGDFVRTLRRADTRGRTWRGRGRGGDLSTHDEWMEACLRASAGLVDVPRVRALWQQLRVLPSAGSDVMSHTDLIPGNVLVRDGRLAGVLDGGGFGPADPALDLVGGWHLLEAGPRKVLRETVGCTDLEWRRGQAWALDAGDGGGLVLPAHQSRHEPDGRPHCHPAAHRQRGVSPVARASGGAPEAD